MLTFTTRTFEPDDARVYVTLAADAFSIAPTWQRPKDSVEFIAHTHSAANPAGPSLVSIGRQDGREVGYFSAIPARYVRPDSTRTIGWQMSCLALSRGIQRQGLGTQLVVSLLDELAKRPDDFVYGFPNLRSSGLLVKLGGRFLDWAPSVIVAPSASKSVRSADGSRASIERVDARVARELASRIPEVASAPGGFTKDRAYFTWRFLGPDADRRSRFVHVTAAEEEFLVVLGSHRAKGVEFTVLVDVYPDVFARRFGLVLRAARAAGGGKPVYVTTNASGRVDTSGSPLRVRVPRRFDPRPVGTLIMPRTRIPDRDLSSAPVITGDWMSF